MNKVRYIPPSTSTVYGIFKGTRIAASNLQRSNKSLG